MQQSFIGNKGNEDGETRQYLPRETQATHSSPLSQYELEQERKAPSPLEDGKRYNTISVFLSRLCVKEKAS
jgi:hypothetical protein